MSKLNNPEMEYRGRKALNLVILVIFALMLFHSTYSLAQPGPIPCIDPLSCPGGCKSDGKTCWDIDDPTPLDSGLLFLIAGGIIFGLYKLNTSVLVKK